MLTMRDEESGTRDDWGGQAFQAPSRVSTQSRYIPETT
jgi:hypothetical protein